MGRSAQNSGEAKEKKNIFLRRVHVDAVNRDRVGLAGFGRSFVPLPRVSEAAECHGKQASESRNTRSDAFRSLGIAIGAITFAASMESL